MVGARRLDRIDALSKGIVAAGGQAQGQVLDVTDLKSMQAFVSTAQDRFGQVDVLVNNAGVMATSMMEDLRIADWNEMIDVNIRGVLNGVAAVLPILRAQGAGHIINIGSTSAYTVDPTAGVYAATKHAVRAISEGLRQESRDIRVTLISPGVTRTELFERVDNPQVRAHVAAMLEASSIPAHAIAEAIAYAIGQPDSVDVNELMVRPTRQA
jgi:NADP-dependent 3-hydroxy acid dehydrogenase YdfG